MKNSKTIQESFKKLYNYCNKEEFKGWDPFDGLNSTFFQNSFLKDNKFSRLAWIQFFKRSPLNFREVLKVEKDFNPKALGLFLYAFCQLYKNKQILDKLELSKDEIRNKIDFFTKKIIDLSSQGYSGACWGYNFDWQNRVFFQPKFTPTVVVTSFVADSLFESYEITKDENILETALSSSKFVTNDLNNFQDDSGLIFSYSPLDNSRVFNASLLGARLLARCYFYSNESKLLDLSKLAVNYVVNKQNEDGSWIYGENKVQNWIDSFHTGFILECLFEYSKYSLDNSSQKSFEKGIEFYLNNFFLDDGTPKYYHDKVYPIDIHSPAQLIVTAVKANFLSKKIDLIQNVVEWTINNMQGKERYFFYQINRFFSSKISYIRWAQAWMFYSLSLFLISEHE